MVVASASLDVSLRAWCAREGLELVATGLEVEDGLCTGRMCPPNCHGAEKLRRVRVHLGGRRDALYLYAYGDSRGDLPMLRAADEGWFRGFDGPALPHPPGWQAQRWMTEGADRC